MKGGEVVFAKEYYKNRTTEMRQKDTECIWI